MTVPETPPPNWGADGLTVFLDQARANQFATFVHKPDWYRRLSAIDACFATASRDWSNPQSEVAALLLIRTHGAYRAACGAALSGQAAETFVLLRAALEAAGYALHIQRNPALALLWLKRHDSDADLKAAKKAFEVGSVRRTVEAADRAGSKVFDKLYQRTIDHGAHPNMFSILGNASVEPSDRGRDMSHILLHGDGLALDHGLKSTAQAGICCLEILQCAFAARFELLGLRHRLLELRKGL